MKQEIRGQIDSIELGRMPNRTRQIGEGSPRKYCHILHLSASQYPVDTTSFEPWPQ